MKCAQVNIAQTSQIAVKPHNSSYLPRGADALPQREVADDVDGEQAQRHVPLHRAQVVQPRAAVQLQDRAARRNEVLKVSQLIYFFHRFLAEASSLGLIPIRYLPYL